MSGLTFFKQTLKKSSFRFIKKIEPKLQQFPVYTPSPHSIHHHQHPHQMVHLSQLMSLRVCVRTRVLS